MKATIDRTGVLRITGETELEAYALTKWIQDNSLVDEKMIPAGWHSSGMLVKAYDEPVQVSH